MSDIFLRERAADFRDIRNCLLEILSGEAGNDGGSDESVLLAGEEITPSDLMRSTPGSLLGIITAKGGYESHIAILARGMGIPGIVCPRGIKGVSDGAMAALDATEGILYLDPDEETLARLQAKQEALQQEAESAAEVPAEPFVTAEGRTIRICANISGPSDMTAVLRSGADGIGLFRTEMQYLGSTMAPDEEKQYDSYRQVIEQMTPRPVILRTFDVGSDKCPDYLNLPVEDNPALGLRGIRLSLTMRDLFKAQLRAILRASACGPVGLLLPMVVSLREVEESKALIAECKEELKSEGKPYGDPKLGIMIETPAAVLCAEELAPAVDFFSFGTNDLTQYICASDRQNTLTEPFADGHHPAVLKAIAMAAKAATDAGIPVGICGELASDLTLTEEFLRMGIEELSVNPGAVLPLRKKLEELRGKV
jgi:phosphotransferase system enzyme I (PtsI)